MRKESFYLIVIVLLLLLNLGTLGYVWMGQPTDDIMQPPHGSPDNVIINRLKLDDNQQSEFLTFMHKHRYSTDSMQLNIRMLQKSLFGLLKEETMNEPLRDSLLHEIERCETAKHMITIDHFFEIRSILTPEQKELFNGFMEDIGSRITGPGRHPPTHPHHMGRRKNAPRPKD